MLTWLDRRRRAAALASHDRAGSHARRQLRQRQHAWLRQAWKGVALLAVWFTAVVGLEALMMGPSVRSYAIGATVAGFFWCTHVLLLQTGDVLRWQSGVDAELWTAHTLRRLRRHGWRLVNHVPTDGGDIDHALVGPGGYVAIETKYRSRWSDERETIDPIVRQARRAAGRLSARLQLGTRARALPVVVAWGGACEDVFVEAREIDGVLFIAGPQLRRVLLGWPATVSAQDVERAYEALATYMQRVEPGEIGRDGPVPTTIAGGLEHALAVLMAATGCALALALVASVPPTGWWSVAAAVVLAVAAVLVRRGLRPTRRVRYVTTAVITVAGAVGAVLLAVLAAAALV